MPFNDTLFQRLRLAKRPDLEALLVDLKENRAKFASATDEDLIGATSAKLRSAAGNSIRNGLRDPHDFPYKQILIDVADKLAPGRLSWTSFKVSGEETEEQIEHYIYERLQVLTEEYLKSLGDADKAELQKRLEADLRARGFPEHVVHGTLSAVAGGTLTGILVGPLLAATLFGTLLTSIFGLSLGQLVIGGLAGGGPVGLVVAAAHVATSASYSKTVPAVARLILIRRSHEAESKLADAR